MVAYHPPLPQQLKTLRQIRLISEALLDNISALVAKVHNHQALQISLHFLILIGFLANAPTFLLQPTNFFIFDLACM